MGFMHSRKNNGKHQTKQKHRKFGESLPSAWEVKLAEHQSISSFFANSQGSDLVAYERFSDGTFYFTGNLPQSTVSRYGITQKFGWKPEIRHSRTLSIVVKGQNGDVSPRISIKDAMSVVKNCLLWKEQSHIELVRVATTTGKATHVFVQFEGELMARKYVNTVDAFTHVQESTGKTLIFHGSQLNAYFEYESQPGGAFDALVWRNPDYVGFRSISVTFSRPQGTSFEQLQDVPDNLFIEAIQEATESNFGNVEAIKRVDMDVSNTHVVILVREHSVPIMVRALRKMIGSKVGCLTAKSVNVKLSRSDDYERSDRVVFEQKNQVQIQKQQIEEKERMCFNQNNKNSNVRSCSNQTSSRSTSASHNASPLPSPAASPTITPPPTPSNILNVIPMLPTYQSCFDRTGGSTHATDSWADEEDIGSCAASSVGVPPLNSPSVSVGEVSSCTLEGSLFVQDYLPHLGTTEWPRLDSLDSLYVEAPQSGHESDNPTSYDSELTAYFFD